MFRMLWEHHLKVSGCFCYFFPWLTRVCAVPWKAPTPTHQLMALCRASERGSSRSIRQNLSKIQGVRLPKTRKNSHLVTIWVLLTRVEYTISWFKLHLRSKANCCPWSFLAEKLFYWFVGLRWKKWFFQRTFQGPLRNSVSAACFHLQRRWRRRGGDAANLNGIFNRQSLASFDKFSNQILKQKIIKTLKKT